MALVSRRWRDDDWLWPERDSIWRDRISRDWDDWPVDWPRPRDLIDRFRRDSDRWWRDWPSDWPRMDAIVPRFSSHLDRFDRNWRNDPFWRDLYPRWAEPIFKEGIDVKTNIVNDRNRFAVDLETYQFRPEELQVKTMDDTLLIEGRHEDVRDPDNYTKMYFVRKYQLPTDVDPQDISSQIDSHGRLTVEAHKRYPAIDNRERTIPIAHSESGALRRPTSRSSSYSPRDRHDSGRGSDASYRQNGYNYRNESRNTLDPNYLSPQANGYKNEYSTRSTDQNGVRHERHREQFREEFRRTGSHSSIPPAPLLQDSAFRSESRQSGGYRRDRSPSSSRNDFHPRVETPGETILRPAEELGESARRSESRAESMRSVRISKSYA